MKKQNTTQIVILAIILLMMLVIAIQLNYISESQKTTENNIRAYLETLK